MNIKKLDCVENINLNKYILFKEHVKNHMKYPDWLGDFSKELHEKIGNEIDENIDVLITVGNEAKYIAKNAKAKEIFEYDSNKDAINRIKNIINQNDAILLKASNGMRFFDIASSIQEF